MSENREPVTCSECGTVNPYINTTCRDCGASLAASRTKMNEDTSANDRSEDGASSDPLSAPNRSATLKPNAATGRERTRRLNALWMIIGVTLYILIMTLGEAFITKQLIEADPDRSQVYKKLQNTVGELSEEDKARYFETMKPIVQVGLVLSVLTPLLVGLILGYVTGSLRESAIGMGVSVLLIFLLNSAGQGLGFIGIAVLGGILSAGLGTLGAFSGRYLRARLRAQK